MKKQIQNKSFFSLSLVFLLLVFSFVFLPFSWRQMANALTNYSKSSGDSLDATDWNNLDNDFLATDGSNTMNSGANIVLSGGGNIKGLPDVPANNNDAASKAYVDSIVGGSANITNTSGENLKMVCGRTDPGATNWIEGSPSWYVDVDISGANFTEGSMPYIFTSLGGYGNEWISRGATSISATNPSTLDNLDDMFRIYIIVDDGSDFSTFKANGWYINWCAIGK